MSRHNTIADIQWTVCCVMHTRIHFQHLPPTATIFYIRIDLVQTVVLRSPRDRGPGSEDKAIHTTRRHIISKQGKRPAKEVKKPDASFHAVWRGVNAGGEDDGEFNMVTKGRLPNDVDSRPSTLEG